MEDLIDLLKTAPLSKSEREQTDRIMDKMEESLDIQSSSSELMTFLV